jgi:hypothetical protein
MLHHLGVGQRTPAASQPAFPIYAKISQERGAFTVSIRLQNHLKKSETAWGEKLAPSIEVASSMIGALAAQFSIPEKCISIEIGMENYRDGTRH